MPIINIKFSTPMPDEATRAKVAQKITDIMVNDLGKNASRVVISMEELPNENIYFGGESITMIKEKAKK